MAPIITYTTQAKAAASLTLAQAKARMRTIVADDLNRAREAVERELSSRLFKRDWAGVTARVDLNAQHFPSSYRGAPESTIVHLRRDGGVWHYAITRGYTDTRCVRLAYPDDMGAAMLAYARAQA